MANLYESTKASSVYQGMLEERPNNATLYYALYLLRQGKDTAQEALDLLARAVELDAADALEYLSLAQTAAERRLGNVELEMLDAARRLAGENLFVRLRRAEALLRAGTPGDALAVAEELQELRWSPLYHPEIPGVLDALAARMLRAA